MVPLAQHNTRLWTSASSAIITQKAVNNVVARLLVSTDMQLRGVQNMALSYRRNHVRNHPFTASQKHPRQCVRLASPKAATDTKGLVDDLQQLISSRQGLDTPTDLEQKILSTVAQLKDAHREVVTTDAKLLSATWKLLWTTEKETLFIIKNAPIFGTKAGDVYQVIDVEAKRLQNVITFPPSGAFIVDSSIAVDGPQRVNFKFTSAKLKTASRDFGVPPFGQGWFDTIYCDGNIRVAQDIRGDTLVVVNDGPPRIFT